MKLGFGPKYFLKCVLTDSVNNLILKKIDFGLNGPDCVTYCKKLTRTGLVRDEMSVSSSVVSKHTQSCVKNDYESMTMMMRVSMDTCFEC